MVKKIMGMRLSHDSAVCRRGENDHTVYTTDYDKYFQAIPTETIIMSYLVRC